MENKIKFDERNYRKHSDQNKKIIKKSLQELGAGRSVVIDADDTLVAGNGVYEQAQALKMPVRVVETDGSELVVVKRTDIHTTDEKRKKLALADNAAGDLSEWNVPLIKTDWAKDVLSEFGVELPDVVTDDPEIERKRKEFEERMANGENLEEDEEYQQFLDKFKLKKTTDYCYTPDIVYDAVAVWVASEYGLDRKKFVRPFYPGGDYKREKYPKGCIVVDNPPFSILSEILTHYKEQGVKFFLFAPHLTLFSSSSSSSAIVTGVGITYENGANVNTSFLTNLEPEEVRARSCPSLYAAVKTANDANLAQMHKELPKYSYDHHVVTASMLSPFSRLGIDFVMTKAETVSISQLDAQKESGKAIYGKGYLISEHLFEEREKAEREKVEREKVEQWKLSEREKAIIKKLSK